MQQADVGPDSHGLGPDVLRGITLQELDKHAQSHGDLVSIYLGWLQEHLNDWDLSDSAVFRPQIESWSASLRFHGYDDQQIRVAFAAWMASQIEDDASCARRFLVAQEELFSILDGDQTMQPRDLGMDEGTAGVITVKECKIIDVSSGDGDSDVEFLGWKRPENMRRTSKPGKHVSPPLTGANKETQRMQATENRKPNDRLKGSKTRKVAPSRIPSGTPPKRYVCDRCGEKGHFKEQCPTNLDPSFDPKPTGGYQCYCCGAREKHLTTLCPHNENPDSVTQQRIKAGIRISVPSSPPRGADHSHPPYNQSRKAKNIPSRSMDSAAFSGNRHGIGHVEDGDDHRMDPDRRARLERDESGHSSPRSDDRMRGLERSHYSPPRERRRRRSRTQDPQHVHQTKRVRRWREKPRSDSRSNSSERGGSAELLPRVNHYKSDDGRLSYWDDDYNDLKMSSTVSSDECRRSVPSVNQPSDRLEAEIQRCYPDADASWVSDMAGFDLDEFFHGLDDDRSALSIIPSGGNAQMEVAIFDDEDGQALPTVKLPPTKDIAPESISHTISGTQTFFYKHQSRTNDTDERSWYGFREGDNDGTSHDHNSGIVVKLPQLKVNSPSPDRAKSEISPDVTIDESERPLKDKSPHTDNGDVGQDTMILSDG